MEPEKRTFIGKRCSLKFYNDFVLHGVVENENEAGIFFTTDQKKSFISWSSIKELIAEW
jgi:hypothetical protein